MHLHRRTKSVTIPHDTIVKVHVVRVNPGIRNYQNFVTAFNSVVQSEVSNSFDFDHDYFGNEIFAFRSVEHHREQQHQDAAKLI